LAFFEQPSLSRDLTQKNERNYFCRRDKSGDKKPPGISKHLPPRKIGDEKIGLVAEKPGIVVRYSRFEIRKMRWRSPTNDLVGASLKGSHFNYPLQSNNNETVEEFEKL